MKNLSARSVVETLYRAILVREADSSGRDHFTALIEGGASAEDVAAALRGSPEYQARLRGRAHPLAVLPPGSYQEEDVSYFMHRGRFRPLTISIETINICNNDCVICPYSEQTRKRQTMAFPLFEKIIQDYTEVGGGPVSLTPLVGEVFLDKHLADRLALLRKAPAISDVSVTTSAVMVHRFDDERLRAILSDIDRINISVYGMDRVEYATMTRRDEYDLFRRQLVRILSLAPTGSATLAVRQLRRRSEEEVAAWRIELEKDASIESVRISSLTHKFANWSHFDTTKPLPFDAEWQSVSRNTKQCGIPLLGLQIMSDGRVSYCACANFDGTPELVIGDLNEQTLAEILDTAGVADLWNWDGCGVPAFCQTCSFHVPLDRLGSIDWVYRNPVGFIGG